MQKPFPDGCDVCWYPVPRTANGNWIEVLARTPNPRDPAQFINSWKACCRRCAEVLQQRRVVLDGAERIIKDKQPCGPVVDPTGQDNWADIMQVEGSSDGGEAMNGDEEHYTLVDKPMEGYISLEHFREVENRAIHFEKCYNSTIEEMKRSNQLIAELQQENRELKQGVFDSEMGKKARELLIERDALLAVLAAEILCEDSCEHLECKAIRKRDVKGLCNVMGIKSEEEQTPPREAMSIDDIWIVLKAMCRDKQRDDDYSWCRNPDGPSMCELNRCPLLPAAQRLFETISPSSPRMMVKPFKFEDALDVLKKAESSEKCECKGTKRVRCPHLGCDSSPCPPVADEDCTIPCPVCVGLVGEHAAASQLSKTIFRLNDATTLPLIDASGIWLNLCNSKVTTIIEGEDGKVTEQEAEIVDAAAGSVRVVFDRPGQLVLKFKIETDGLVQHISTGKITVKP